MTVQHINATVGTTAKVLVQMPTGIKATQVNIYNNDTNPIYLGGNNVTVTAGTNQGFTVVKGTPFSMFLNANDVLYAISSAGTSTGAVVVVYSA